jgi:glycosyltransferase EpsE
MKLVSAVLPIFNEQLLCLQECISGVLCQSYKNIELIIVDDSTDKNTIDYLTNIALSDARVIYVHNRERIGFVKSLNKGLSCAKGDYIARVDSDDIQKDDRFERQTAFMESHPEIGIVGSSFEKISEKGRALGVRRYPESPESIKKRMTIKNAVAHPTVMIRKKVFACIGFYDESFPKAEDYELWMRALRKGIKIANINEPLVKYRISDIVKRDNANWKYNLRVKLRHFAFDRYILQRMTGVAAVGLMVILPSFVKQFLYSMYNRMV